MTQPDDLRSALEAANLDVIDAMLTWPEGAKGPLAVAAYEALVRRLVPLRAAIAAIPSEVDYSPLLDIRYEADNSWSVCIRAMPGHVGAADTLQQAIVEAADAAEVWIETLQSRVPDLRTAHREEGSVNHLRVFNARIAAIKERPSFTAYEVLVEDMLEAALAAIPDRNRELEHALSGAARDLEQLRARWAEWIRRDAEFPRDNACVECVPSSPILVPGFRCVPHEAAAYKADAKERINASGHRVTSIEEPDAVVDLAEGDVESTP